MGCVVVSKSFLKENPLSVMTFIDEYGKSIDYVKNNPKEAGELCAKYGIVPAAAIATKAIPDCNLIFVTGDAVRPALEGYLKVLFDSNPKAVGGKMPGADFYTVKD